jgi:hypothetical protein
MGAQQTEMMQILRQMQHDQHDYTFRTKQTMSGLIDEMSTLTMHVEDLQNYTTPHQPGNDGRARTLARRRQ